MDLDQHAAFEELRQANRSLLRQLADAKRKREELHEAAYKAAKEAASALSLSPVKAPPSGGKASTPITAIAVLSDWQLGKKTPSYTSSVCEKRIHRYGDKLLAITELQRSNHPVDDLRIFLLGDLVEGEMIFPGQSHLIDASLFQQVMTNGPRILGDFVRRMLGSFQHVRASGVIGNHGAMGGRARKDYHPETNADAMLYEVVRLVCEKETRLEWAPNVAPGERHWYAVEKVGSKSFLLWHGDQSAGGGALGYPWYSFGKLIAGWRLGAVREPFDYSLSGHYHTPVRFQVGPITHWGNGSTESDNTYAAERLAAMGRPSQWLLFCHPKLGVISEHCIYLD